MNLRAAKTAAIATLVVATVSGAWAAQPLGCLIEPSRVVEVGSPVIGLVESVKVERGDRVAKGQVVAMLRSDVERAAVGVAASRARVTAEVRAAQANYDLARQKLTRARDLVSQKFISEQALEQAHAEAEVARQRLEQANDQRRIWERELHLAEAQLELRTIRSPVDGVVVERYMSGGERVEEKPIVRIATVNPLRVEVVVPASLYGTIAVGSMLTVTPQLPNAKARQAKVVLVDSVIDGPSNTFRVRLDLPNPDYDLPPGPRCRIDLSSDAGFPAAMAAPQGQAAQAGDVADAISLWAKAWSSNDVAGYLAHYATGFETPTGMSRAEWEAQRRARIAKPRRIGLGIESLKVRFDAEGRAVASFRQRYRSDDFEADSYKTLVLVRPGTRWLIQREESGE